MLCKLIGVTEAPDNDIIVLLVHHLQQHHKDFSNEEVQKAFSLAMAGKLNFDFVHYNRITPQLLSKTLNNYKTYRSKEIMAFEEKLRKEERLLLEEKNKPTPEQKLYLNIKGVLMYYKRKLEKKQTIDWGNHRYDFLATLGIIDYSKEQREEIKKKAQEELISEKKREGNRLAKDEFKQAMIRKESKEAISEIRSGKTGAVVSRAKQIALDMYFDTVVEKDIDFSNDLKKALMSGDELQKNAAKKML